MCDVQILLFRKGQVCANPNLTFANLPALAELSVASQPHKALLSTAKGPAGQQATMQLNAILANQQANGSNDENSRAAAAAAATELATTVQESIQRRNSTGQLSDGRAPDSKPSALGYPMSAPGSPTAAGRQRLGLGGHFCDATATHPARLGPRRRFQPTPPFEKTDDMSWLQTFAHKFLQSKWGPIPAKQCATLTTKFPFAALWHLDFSSMYANAHVRLCGCAVATYISHIRFAAMLVVRAALRGDGAKRASWLASCTFDTGRDLHTFGAVIPCDQQSDATEHLAQQLLRHDIVWRLTHCCLMQELKSRRREPATRSTAPVMRMLLKPPAQVAEQERDEHAQSPHRQIPAAP